MTLVRLGSDTTRTSLGERVSLMKKRRGKPLGFSTGFPALDAPFGGLIPGQVTVLAARPGMGKTALFLSIARNMTRAAVAEGVADKYAVCFFSLEMSREALLTREALGDAGIDSRKFRTGQATDRELDAFEAASDALADEPLYVDDTPAVTIEYMERQILALRDSGVIPVLIGIDHLGITGEKGQSLYESTTKASNGVKRLAKTANAPVIALAQLSRAVEQREDKHPILSDLRESGAIEQDADNVVMLYRHDYYYPTGTAGSNAKLNGIAELWIAKARDGSQGDIVRLRFNGPRTRFEAM